MDETILTGIIGGLFTLIAAIVSPFISRAFDRKRYSQIAPIPTLDKRDALIGEWTGTYIQKSGRKDSRGEHRAQINFRRDRGIIVGSLYLYSDKSIHKHHAHLINIIFDGNLLKVDYVNKNSNVTHFGTIFGRFSADALRFEGPFIGYGIVSEMFVNGTFRANKISNSKT